MIVALLTATAVAGLMDPIDPNRRVDANSRYVNTPTLNMKSAPMPVLRNGRAEQSNRIVQPQRVEMNRVELGTYETKTVDTPVIPQMNFHTKRAASSDQTYRTETAKTGLAPVNPRRIRPLTPQGENELKDQLRRRDW